MTKRATLLFAGGDVFDIIHVFGINPTAQHDVCAFTVLYSSHTFTITISEQPIAQRPVVQALSFPKNQTSLYSVSPFRKTKRHCTRYVRVTYHLRTASVRFIQEEPHNIILRAYCFCIGQRNNTVVPKMLQVVPPCSVHMYIIYFCILLEIVYTPITNYQVQVVYARL